MKRLTSLVLALLLALTMMVGAFAETADVTFCGKCNFRATDSVCRASNG